MRCLHCGEMRANFTHLKFENDKIYFWINCVLCGEDSYHYITFDILKGLFLNWFFNPGINPDSQEFSFWRMFQLGWYYPTCFKSKADQERFSSFWHDLETDLNKYRRRVKK
jgi:hypothetical protein